MYLQLIDFISRIQRKLHYSLIFYFNYKYLKYWFYVFYIIYWLFLQFFTYHNQLPFVTILITCVNWLYNILIYIYLLKFDLQL